MTEECEDVVAHRNRSVFYGILSAASAAVVLGAGLASAYDAEPFGDYSDEVFGIIALLGALGTGITAKIAITERIEANKGCQHEE